MIREKIMLFCCMALLLTSGCFASDQAIPEVYNITVGEKKDESLTWDFGKVKAGDIVKHNFVFTNESSKELNIANVNTSCGCTGSQIKKKKLEPGESTGLEVKFNSKGYNGVVTQHIYVSSDNKENPTVVYTIKADVVK